jgi:zinc/manganese transport system substrate-binding protein
VGPWKTTTAALSLVAVAGLAGACSTAGGTAGGITGAAGGGRVIQVVAAENFWGSIASQLGGRHARVTSIITNPSTDPHSYEPTAGDARAVALAGMVIENGVGYDPWAGRLLAADDGSLTVLDVGSVLGVPGDGNPHRWYNPADVQAIADRITADYRKLDPADRGYFTRLLHRFRTAGLRQYHALVAAIRARFAGTPVGASESIFAMLAPSLGLRLITPYSFLRAISEGTEVSAADKQTIDHQISGHLIEIYVYNSQNVTPDVRAQLAAARAAGIPVATITETLAPASATYQAWQVRQLRGIEAALVAARTRQAGG